ncbi:hypothetical protein F4808DRAFT_428570 [Astrocystis sublimbata]|nr:hypothetical protein F4808DRAFT_428570 [Astrocystis sublimbata]
MSRKAHKFEILCDSGSAVGGDLPLGDRRRSVSPQSQAFRQISISQSQNRQRVKDCVDTNGQGIHELRRVSCNTSSGATQKHEKRIGGRLTRPSITPSTFEVLNPVAESEPQTAAADPKLSADAQQILQLPVDRYSSHSLSVAALDIPPLEEQLAKHRNGLFEWILAVSPPNDKKLQQENRPIVHDSHAEIRKVYFGCNLLPEPSSGKNGAPKSASQASRYSLLVTELKATQDVLSIFDDHIHEPAMAPLQENLSRSTPLHSPDNASLRSRNQDRPGSTAGVRGDDSPPQSIMGSSYEDDITRIEDSFEALDMLEDQLEAFDKDARFNEFIATEKLHPPKERLVRHELSTPNLSVRFATPQPERHVTRPGSTSLRVKAASEPRKSTLRKMTSMTLDSPKLRVEEKDLIQLSPHRGSTLARSSSQRLPSKPTKKLTIPSFELPGEAVARQLREKKEAREASLAAQRATQPTASSLRRAKSAKLPTRPAFELPGEAISRRKREDHQAQLRAQEEEERKRRTFRARPAPSHSHAHGTPATVPRDTVASRARQNAAAWAENSARSSTPNRRPLSMASSHAHPRSVLSSTSNQVQPRGRISKVDRLSADYNPARETSTSTSSMSGKRSSVSFEDVQMQRIRGHDLYQRENSWADTRLKEKYEREAMAKMAREEAAERSRQQSREWAAKQARKRMTVGSMRDVIGVN